MNEIIVAKESRIPLEKFMGYDDGFLPSYITWNDIMPIVNQVSLTFVWDHTKKNGIQSALLCAELDWLYTEVVKFVQRYQAEENN